MINYDTLTDRILNEEYYKFEKIERDLDVERSSNFLEFPYYYRKYNICHLNIEERIGYLVGKVFDCIKNAGFPIIL